jgi:hypothetical protein
MKFIWILYVLFLPIVYSNDAVYVEKAKAFIVKYSTVEIEKKWQKRWKERVEQALKDNDALNENSYTDTVLMDWLIARRNIKEEEITIEDKLQACRFYILYKEKNMELPERVSKELTDERLDMFFRWCNENKEEKK